MRLPASPFKGLSSFGDSEQDRRLFFGRERETEVVAANLMASRLTVLYGPSGVGKSSLLRAGVASRLRSLAPALGPHDGAGEIVIVESWRDDPVAAVAGAVVGRTDLALADALAERALALGGELYLVLDQMEEYVLYHGRGGGPLASELEDVLTRPDLPVHVLLGIRDDALADLDAFKRRVPGLFGNVLRLDHLTRAAARAAIDGPLRAYAELGGVEVTAEDELVEAVLDQVGAGRVEHGLTGRGLVAEGRARRVEAPYLQLVLERLWQVERERGSTTLRAATLGELGGATRIVEEHLERALSGLDPTERDVASQLFNHLVTPSGTKISHSVADLARYTGPEQSILERILGSLDSARIVRRVPGRSGGPPRYEIFHDVLAQAVLAWRSRHEAERSLAAERATARQRQRRLAAFAGAAVVALALVAALAVWALAQRADARDQARAAHARELTVAALSQLETDPELALLLALEASEREQTPDVESALRDALLRTRALASLRLSGAVLAAAPVRAGVIAVTDDGLLRDVNGRTRRLAPHLGTAAFAPDGRFVAAAQGATAQVWLVSDGSVMGTLTFDAPVVRLAFDGTTLAAAAADGAVSVRRLGGGERFRTRVPSRATALAVRGDVLLVASGHVVRVYDLGRRALVRTLEPEPSTVLGLAVAPDGSSFVSTGADSGVRLRALPDGALRDVLRGHRDQATGVALVPDGSRLVTIGGDGLARVWDTLTGRPIALLAGHGAELSTIAVSADGGRAATGDRDGVVRLWRAAGDPTLQVLERLDGDPVALTWRDGRARAVGSATRDPRIDPRVRVQGSTVRLPGGPVLRGHTNRITSVRYSRDRTRVITASQDRDARIWDARTGVTLLTLSGHFGRVGDASFSGDGRWAVTAGPDSAAVWDARTGTLLTYLRGHDGLVQSAIFAPDNRTVLTLGADRTIRSWRCDVCASLDDLVPLARRRLDSVGRRLTPTERARYKL